MPGRTTTTFVFASALLSFAGGISITLVCRATPLQRRSPVRYLQQARDLPARCASCHNEGGDKPLKTGAPLNERGLSMEVIAQAVNGRLRDRAEDERRAVTLYISSLMKSKNPGNNALPKP
jgi:mono/diheme cytochrome c family protein